MFDSVRQGFSVLPGGRRVREFFLRNSRTGEEVLAARGVETGPGDRRRARGPALAPASCGGFGAVSNVPALLSVPLRCAGCAPRRRYAFATVPPQSRPDLAPVPLASQEDVDEYLERFLKGALFVPSSSLLNLL